MGCEEGGVGREDALGVWIGVGRGEEKERACCGGVLRVGEEVR
jgi:hypothetical protein